MLRNSNRDPFFGAGIKSEMSRESGVFAVPVKPGSTENWNPRRCGILVVRRAPRFWMPDSLCKFLMFTANDGSVNLSSVAAYVIFANFSRSFCTARRRGMNAFCARSWASRVAVEPVPWAPPLSLRCVTVVSGPISGLYFLRRVSAMWSMSAVRTPVSVNTIMGHLASMSALV